MDVSFLVPTYREFSKYAQKTIDSILAVNLKRDYDIDYEIIVCSKSPIEYEQIIWVKEPDENQGSVLPINLAYHQARGKYVSLLNDDFNIDNSFPKVLQFMESDTFRDRKIKVSGLYPDKWIEQNDMKWIPDHNWQFLPAQMLCFPVVDRENAIKHLGRNLLDSRFKHHWSDVWLTFYIFKKFNETAPLCKDALIWMREASSSSYNDNVDTGLYFQLTRDFNPETEIYQ
jgi:glycosyltransferase involved in cell wall biosynthesis